MSAQNSFSALQEDDYQEPQPHQSEEGKSTYQKKQRQPPLIGSNRLPQGEYKVKNFGEKSFQKMTDECKFSILIVKKSAVEYKPKVVPTEGVQAEVSTRQVTQAKVEGAEEPIVERVREQRKPKKEYRAKHEEAIGESHQSQEQPVQRQYRVVTNTQPQAPIETVEAQKQPKRERPPKKQYVPKGQVLEIEGEEQKEDQPEQKAPKYQKTHKREYQAKTDDQYYPDAQGSYAKQGEQQEEAPVYQQRPKRGARGGAIDYEGQQNVPQYQRIKHSDQPTTEVNKHYKSSHHDAYGQEQQQEQHQGAGQQRGYKKGYQKSHQNEGYYQEDEESYQREYQRYQARMTDRKSYGGRPQRQGQYEQQPQADYYGEEAHLQQPATAQPARGQKAGYRKKSDFAEHQDPVQEQAQPRQQYKPKREFDDNQTRAPVEKHRSYKQVDESGPQYGDSQYPEGKRYEKRTYEDREPRPYRGAQREFREPRQYREDREPRQKDPEAFVGENKFTKEEEEIYTKGPRKVDVDRRGRGTRGRGGYEGERRPYQGDRETGDRRDSSYHGERRAYLKEKFGYEDKPKRDGLTDDKKDEKKDDHHEEKGEKKRFDRDRKPFDDKNKFEKRRYDDGPPIEEEPEPQGMTYEEFKAHQDAKRKNLQKAKIREHDNTKEKKTGGLEEAKKQNEKQKQINLKTYFSMQYSKLANIQVISIQK